jgi:chemotaxis signal transduction protein
MTKHEFSHEMHTTVIVLRVGVRRVALRLDDMREIVPACAVTASPRLPRHVPGVMNFHGDILPVIDVSCILTAIPTVVRSFHHFVLCCAPAGGNMALLVDEALELADIDAIHTLQLHDQVAEAPRFVIHDGEVLPLLLPQLMLSETDMSLLSCLPTKEALQKQEIPS